MIIGRGGIEALSHKSELQTVLVRLDAMRAYITLAAPRYPTYACIRSLQPLAINVPPSTSNAALPLSSENPDFAFCGYTLHLVHALEGVLLLIWSISYDSLHLKPGRLNRDLVFASVQQCLSPSAILPSISLNTFLENAHVSPHSSSLTPLSDSSSTATPPTQDTNASRHEDDLESQPRDGDSCAISSG